MRPLLPRLLRLLLVVVPWLVTAAPPALADNPFGLMLWQADGGSLELSAARAAALGIAWFRPPAVFIDRWQPALPCPACAVLARYPFRLALTVRSDGRRAAFPPHDLDAYGKTLGSILDAWKPALVVVENEENLLFPSPDDYARELAAACGQAHDRGILCTNGGLSGDAAAGLAWFTLLQSGRSDIACDFARRALYTEDEPEAGAALCSYRTSAEVPPERRDALLKNADRLIPVYRAAPIDAVNFHWYGHDAGTLATTAAILGELTGKPVLSNEIGQRPWDVTPARVRPLMRAAFAAQLKAAIWYSIDSPFSRSLFEESGALRPSGLEFAKQMSGRK